MKQILLITNVLLFTFFSLSNINAQVLIDFETEATSPSFDYFGGAMASETPIIANPDPSGINTSATVGEFIKGANSETWAGAATGPDFTVDLVNNSQVCMDVWLPAPGNAGLKLENGDPSQDWITTAEVSVGQTWVNVCFNALNPSVENANAIGSGVVFNTIVVFFNFGSNATEDVTYYFDNITVLGGAAEPGDVTFSVDMNEYENDFTTVYVRGDFNNFEIGVDELSDADEDGVWTGTVTDVPLGPQTYHFVLDNFGDQELFEGNEACVVDDGSGDFFYRTISVSGDMVLPTPCFGSCYACGPGVTVTINMGDGTLPASQISPDGFFIAGGDYFGEPGDFPLTDNGDGTHSITIPLPPGFETYYTFTNGICPDFATGCKENIAGEDCARPEHFDDRKLGPLTEDIVINTCYGACTETTECEPLEGNFVTFEVDMNAYGEAFEVAYVSGTFNSWSGTANPLSDDDADGIWSASVFVFDEENQYKFQVDDYTVQEFFQEQNACTALDGTELIINRTITVTADTTVCLKWDACVTCDGLDLGVDDLAISHSMFSIQPTLAQDKTTLYFEELLTDKAELQIYNAFGQLLNIEKIAPQSNQYTLNVSHLSNGLYFINVEANGMRQTKRIIVNH